MKRSWSVLTIIVVMVFILAAVCLCLAAGVGVWAYLTTINPANPASPTPASTSLTDTPVVIRPASSPTPPSVESNGTPPPVDTPAAPVQSSAVTTETLQTLIDTNVPIADLLDLAGRLEGKTDLSPTVQAPADPYAVGQKKKFWVTSSDTNQSSQVTAVLRYITDHVYFWVEDGVSYDEGALKKLADTFEKKIYPTNREFFGSEWTPGVDNDPHLVILYARGLGGNVAGYFSSADQFPPTAHEYSNAHEMFLLSADLLTLDDEYTYGVLAHEFQHMIHWYRDRNEETWMNEGFSNLAMLLNKYDVGGADSLYVLDPDIQLNDWPTTPEDRGAHYGASFLFLTYFLDRFGEEATKSLVAEPANGMVSIDKVLQAINAVDAESGQLIGADDVFVDWTLASYLKDKNIGDGRYTYHNYPSAPSPADTESLLTCPTAQLTRDVHQYGVDYIRLQCEAGTYTLNFEGSTQVGVVPVNPHSGNYAFWSNKGDDSNMRLTRQFDFSAVSGDLALSYWTWYDLEKDYDYLYLEASADGTTWQILNTPSGTSEDPSGNSYGWAYNGTSGGREKAEWIEEVIDLSAYAGKKVWLRFEYVTDAAVNGEGLLLDDVSIPAINYSTDFESDDGGWTAEGFARIQNALPQTFRISLIKKGSTTTIEKHSLSGDNSLTLPLVFDNQVKEIILVISGTTRFTRQTAPYRFVVGR